MISFLKHNVRKTTDKCSFSKKPARCPYLWFDVQGKVDRCVRLTLIDSSALLCTTLIFEWILRYQERKSRSNFGIGTEAKKNFHFFFQALIFFPHFFPLLGGIQV